MQDSSPTLSYSHGREFFRQIWPLIEKQNLSGLESYVQQYWPNSMLRGLLGCGHEAAAKAAMLAIALTGTMKDTPSVARYLHDRDPMIASFAEQTLWSIWFRGGCPESNNRLAQAVRCLGQERLDAAICLLNQVLRDEPGYAEAHHQRAIALFLLGQYAAAIEDCRSAIQLNPQHFGALASLGHCHAVLGDLPAALECYRQALRIHPRAEGMWKAIEQVRHHLRVNKLTTPPTSPKQPN